MQQGTKTVHTIVCITFEDDSFKACAWSGSSMKAIRKRVKEAYADAKLIEFASHCWHTYSYGAH